LIYKPLRERFQSEGAFGALPKVALRAIAAPTGAKQDLIMNGEGELVYEAAERPQQHGALQWLLKDSTAELT